MIECRAAGTPVPQVMWWRGLDLIQKSSHLFVTFKEFDNQVLSTLTIAVSIVHSLYEL